MILCPKVGSGLHTFTNRAVNFIGIIVCNLYCGMFRGAASSLYDTEILAASSVDYVLLTGAELRHDSVTFFRIHEDDLAVHPRELVAGEQRIVMTILADDFCLFEGVFCHRF